MVLPRPASLSCYRLIRPLAPIRSLSADQLLLSECKLSRQASSLSVFKIHLKTHLFSLDFDTIKGVDFLILLWINNNDLMDLFAPIILITMVFAVSSPCEHRCKRA